MRELFDIEKYEIQVNHNDPHPLKLFWNILAVWFFIDCFRVSKCGLSQMDFLQQLAYDCGYNLVAGIFAGVGVIIVIGIVDGLKKNLSYEKA